MNISNMPKAEPTSQIIINDGFYPNLDIADFISQYAVAVEYANNQKLLSLTLVLAITEINRALVHFKNDNWQAYDQLANVPSNQCNGVNNYIAWYQHAVFCLTKSKTLISRLGERHRDQRAAQQLQAADNEEYWLAQSQSALRLIMGQSVSATVALI